ncbi:MAG: DUF5060 domain-containing protein [Saprospiraceae bacterium]|nr:DUF5060 domain-containing protein [Saprospiraceae bacterium]
MKKYYIYYITFIFSFIIFSFKTIHAQMPVINAVEPVATTVAQYEKFEVKLNLTATYNNPYDYEEIIVSAVFTGPNNENIIVDGFFMQDFTITSMQTGNISSINNGIFKIRFSPNQTGEWRYVVSCKTASGTATFDEKIFLCVASSNPINKGFVRSSESNYLQFDNEEQYIPIGENMAWQNGNPIVDYHKWLTKLSENKGNFFRLWQAHWGLGIEWRNGTSGFQGLRKYKQTSAFYQDWLFDFCAEKGIYIMLCIQHHGQVSSNVNPNWSESPYNTANGGPCANTWDFFINPAAKNFTRNRLRYIIARWGYARSIMAWELFNEVDWTDQFMQRSNDVATWHAEMAAYLKEMDPYQHLVTTSYAQDHYDPIVWHNPDIDFTQTHYYINIPNVERTLSAGIKKYLNEYNKPTHNGEFGLGGSASGLGALDPDGIHIHNSLWAALFSGSMGSAMTWWWDNYIEPQNLYYHFTSLAEITNEIKFKEDHYTSITSKVNGAPADLSLNPTQGCGALADTLLTIGEGGIVTPADARLSFFLYGSLWNTGLRRRPFL